MTTTKTGRGPTRPVEQRLNEIKKAVARIEKSQTQAGQKKIARARILTGMAALQAAENDPAFAAQLAAEIRSFCTRERDLVAVAEILEQLDQLAGSI